LLLLNLGCTGNRSNLWILSGQSNACGRGALPGPKGIEAVRMFAVDEGRHDPGPGQWESARDPLPGMETWGVSAWVTAAQAVARKGHKIDMLGYALGAQQISHWDRGNEGAKKLFSRIEKHGKGAGVFLWYQGESDTGFSEDAAAYQDKLADLVARVRKTAENPRMTVVIIQLSAKTRPGEARGQGYFMQLREAQRQFVLADGNALLVTALGRAQKQDGHLATGGYMELGEEVARALLWNRFNQRDINWPGPVLDAAVLAAGSRKITAHFAEVKQLSGATPSDFVVVDASGASDAAVAMQAKAGATTLELTFDRRIMLPARLVYAYADSPQATLVDEAGNRAPAVQIDVTIGSPPADEFTRAPNGAGPPCAQLPREMMLWDDAGSPGKTLSRGALKQAIATNCISHILEATLTCFPANNGNGSAVVVCPGGGYGKVCFGREGVVVARWLNSLGLTAFVLKYRLPREGYVHPSPLLDAQRAIRYVRSNADNYGLDPERVGIMGFSAGGHLASTAGTHFDYGDKTAKEAIDRVSSRPDFMILVYPVITLEEPYTHKGSRRNLLGQRQNDEEMLKYLSNNLQVTSDTPPNILIHARDDIGVKAENSILFNQSCLAAAVSSELRIYEKGGHGFDLGRAGTDSTQWPNDCENWLRSKGLID